MRRIICVGNRYVLEDSAGPAVHERLARDGVPAGVELVDGGLGGLSLLRHVEGTERVVFVDRTSGLGAEGAVVVLTAEEVAGTASGAYGHDAGLAYLLRAIPHVLEGALPEIAVVGMEGLPSDELVSEAARVSLGIVTR